MDSIWSITVITVFLWSLPHISMEKLTLILVDFQKDFISGTLAVKGGSSALWRTLELLQYGNIGRVIFTLDWHPLNHCSFKENGGEWPRHCVEHTEGALPNPLLLNYCIQNKIPYEFYCKGERQEEYGAFRDLGEWEYYLSNRPMIDKDEQSIICGIAGDYCVLETIKNLEPIWNNLQVYLPGIASIDGGTKLNRFIDENSLNTLTVCYF